MTSAAGTGILAQYYISVLITLALIVVRSYVRLRITKRNDQGWKWDDTTIIITWVRVYCAILRLHPSQSFRTPLMIVRYRSS